MQKINIEQRENNFTFIRIIAASLVIVSHGYDLLKIGYEPFAIVSGFDTLGGLAVSTFFVISGFLVTASLLRARNGYYYLMNRCLRIFPGFIVAILICAFVLGPIFTELPVTDYFAHPNTWLYLKNIYLYELHYDLPGVFSHLPFPYAINGSIWTLPLEFTAYLLLLFIFLAKGLNSRFILIFITLLMFIHLKIINFFELQNTFILDMHLIQLNKFAIFFFSGALIYLVKEHIPLNYTLFFCAIGLLISSFGVSLSFVQAPIIYYLTWSYIVIFIAYAPLPLARYFEKFGDISYGIYLYGFPVQQTLIYLNLQEVNFWLFLFIAWCISTMLALFSWHLIEKPALKLKKYSFKRQ